MGRLIAFEINKILQKKLVWATLAAMLFLTVIMIIHWVCPGDIYVQVVRDGKITSLASSVEALQVNKEISAEFAGPLTDEKLWEIISRYDWTDEQFSERGIEPAQEIFCLHNSLYDSLKEDFAASDGSYNGRTAQDVYGSLAEDMTLGYSEGWETMNYALINVLLSWGCVVVILISPVFSEEYTRRTDALILTGARGRTQCAAAKVIAAFSVILAGTFFLLLAFLLPFLLYSGKDGWDASVQIGTWGLYTATPYLMNWLEITLFLVLLCITSSITVTAVTLLVSALSKSAFTSLVISFAIYTVPLFLSTRALPVPLQLFILLQPIRQVRTFEWVPYDKLWGQVNVMWLALPFALTVLVLGVLCSKRAFARHQVL